MIETIALLPGVTLRVCRDSRFKQGCLSFQLVRQMAGEEAALNAERTTALAHIEDLRSLQAAMQGDREKQLLLEEKTEMQ